MSQNAAWYACCCGAGTDCCTIWDCETICDNYVIEQTWTETYKTFNGQTLTVTEVRFTYTTGGVRTALPPDPEIGCPEGTIGGYSWSEITVDVEITARDYEARASGACFENLSSTTWQTVEQACDAGIGPGPNEAACIDLCEMRTGCESHPVIKVIPPGSNFYFEQNVRTYTATRTITADDDCDATDPFSIVCDFDTCLDCPKLKAQFACTKLVGDQLVYPIADGFHDFTQTPACEDPIVDEPWSIAISPWSILSDCACTQREPWKQPRYSDEWIALHFLAIDALRGTVAGFACEDQFPVFCEVADGEKLQKCTADYAWECSRPAQGEVCPNHDGVYDAIAFQGGATVVLTHLVTVSCP